MDNSMEVPQKLKIELPHNPATLFLHIYLIKLGSQKDISTLMFMASLFTVTKIGKHSKYSLTGER